MWWWKIQRRVWRRRGRRNEMRGYALPRFAAELVGAGADCVISIFPEDAPRYFEELLLPEPHAKSHIESRQPRAR